MSNRRKAPRSYSEGVLVILSAPSGGGKTTLVDRLLKRHPDWVRSVSVTTRPPRMGEKEGEDYYFA
ncbi:MAG: guanylate kinase, partial [candidate division Zixibacteria bacterium]|nr:guanylate kinase [candidate division Zixibacteria bacterium]